MSSVYHNVVVLLLIVILVAIQSEAKFHIDEKQQHHKTQHHISAKAEKEASVNTKTSPKAHTHKSVSETKKAEELAVKPAALVTPLDVKPAFVGGPLTAPIDMSAKVDMKDGLKASIDNIHTPEDAHKDPTMVERAEAWINTEEEKAEAIMRLNQQPKLVAMVDGVDHERAIPLFSDFPTFSPTPKATGPLPFLHTPTLEPTLLQDCDPKHPPCKKYVAGICTMYHHCEEFVNGTLNDDSLTYEPTHMPVPNPTPAPSNPPTSTPSTSAPTYNGYTPMPTMSFMPTVAETSGPTQGQLCDPQNPPCDHYFFDICLGRRHCYGSHQPTPAPTSSKDTKELHLAANKSPTMKPSMGPTDFAHELAREIYVEGQKEKAEGEAMMAARKAHKEHKKSKK